MNDDNNLKDLLFLTYLTGYDIKDIYSIIGESGNYDIEGYLRYKLQNNSLFSPSTKDIERTIDKAKADAEYALDYLKYQQITAITHTSPKYPKSLKILKDYPPILYVKGKLKKGAFATVVGTRQISDYADGTTTKVINALIDHKYSIVSGLAIGIDTIAHLRTVERNAYTIAVMPNSLDSIYPKENLWLANKILDNNGCLISELAFGINRGRKSFVERNRIQAAFSEMIFPIELGTKSGTMHTVNFGKSQNKAICLLKPANKFATLPQYEGVMNLIDQQIKKPRKNVFIIKNMDHLLTSLEEKQIKLFNE